MITKKYIYCLAAMLISTACSNHEDLLPNDGQGKDDNIQFTASLQQAATITPRAEDVKEEVLRYVYGIRIRKVDQDDTTDTQLFDVRSGNYGTLDMQHANGTSQPAMKWSDKTNDVDFYAWTVPTGVSINDTETSGTVNFGCIEGEGNKPTTKTACNTYNDEDVTPLEIFISAHKTANFNNDPSVSLKFQHIVSKVSMNVVWWNNNDITKDITIKFPFINKVWKVEQTQGDPKSSFSVTEPADTPTEALSLNLGTLNLLAKNSQYRTFYLPPLTGATYKFEHTGDFEITYNDETYYGSLAEISGLDGITAGQHLQVNIQLNPGGYAGGYATIKTWDSKETTIQTNPYRGIYTKEELEELRLYLESPDGKTLSEALYIQEGDKKIIRLYNDLEFDTETLSLALKDNMVFDGLGHTISVAKDKNLFGDIKPKDDATIEIRNVRLLGAGQLASSLENVTVYNCHANGTGNLVGTAKGTTSFNFCSAENSAKDIEITLMRAVDGNKVTVKNSFVASSAKAFVSSGTITIQNSFIISSPNTYWSVNAASGNSGTTFTIEENNVTATIVEIGGQKTKLIDLLNEGSKDSSNTWVYVYEKSYPVMRIK